MSDTSVLSDIKIMRAADLPGRLPQALSGRRSAASQQLPFDCLASANPVPPKEPPPAFINRERMPPPKLPLTTIAGQTRFTLIYPFVLMDGWQ
jgi:hypothetical protein